MSDSFNLQNFVIYLLKNFGPFTDTPENIAAAMNEQDGEYQIAITPQPDGTMLIAVEEFPEGEDDNGPE